MQGGLLTARAEASSYADYDYVVVNEDGKIDETVAQIAEIIRKESKKPRHYEL